jgi:hypothetical protein
MSLFIMNGLSSRESFRACVILDLGCAPESFSPSIAIRRSFNFAEMAFVDELIFNNT